MSIRHVSIRHVSIRCIPAPIAFIVPPEPTSCTSPIERLWDRLAGVHRLSFVAQSALATGWNGAGRGDVVVTMPAADVLLFHETGTWQPQGGATLPFRNVFRWTQKGAVLQLEHLRFGPDAPVLLCDLARQPDGRWHAVAPHRCQADEYDAHLTVQPGGIDLSWHITGPKKQEHVAYQYGYWEIGIRNWL